MNSRQADLSDKTVLVTGGTGFVGSRLVERLVTAYEAKVRVLVRNYARASRVARFNVELMPGDVTRARDVEQAAAGCKIVFHCACGPEATDAKQRRVIKKGMENVLAASAKAGAERLVHLSTIMVYGQTPDGLLDETAPRRYFGDAYSDSKLDAERMVFDFATMHDLAVTVLQPTVVYGPFAQSWTVNVLQQLKTRRLILVNGGEGLCNPVYVDDLVSAMLLGAIRKEAVGEAFLISGGEAVRWRDFYARHEQMLGLESTVQMTIAEAETLYRKRRKRVLKETAAILRDRPLVRQRMLDTAEVSTFLRFLPGPVRRSLIGKLENKNGVAPGRNGHKNGKPMQLLPPSALRFNAAKTRVSIDKARRLLGYQPAFDFERGTGLTEDWARWANLLDDRAANHIYA